MKNLAFIIIMLIILASSFGCNRTTQTSTAQNTTYVSTSEAGIILEEGYPVWEEHQLPMYESYPVWEEHILMEQGSGQSD